MIKEWKLTHQDFRTHGHKPQKSYQSSKVNIRLSFKDWELSLLEKAKLAREISDGKNEILHKFLSRKI